MPRRPFARLFTLLLLASTGACAEQDAAVAVGDREPSAHADAIDAVLAPERLLQWKLPKSLREISGLALTPAGRLFAIADERAVVHELDYVDGRRLRRFSVGDPAVKGDFEGIAATASGLFAITSVGVLYGFGVGEADASVPFERWDTGLADVCEIEGLTWFRARDTLIIACKTVYAARHRGRILLLQWSLDEARLLADAPLLANESAVAQAIGAKAFNPSGVSLAAGGAMLWLVAARQDAVARFSFDGERLTLLEARRLPGAARHRQTEGIEILDGGAVLLADEGGDGRARLGIYGRR